MIFNEHNWYLMKHDDSYNVIHIVKVFQRTTATGKKDTAYTAAKYTIDDISFAGMMTYDVKRLNKRVVHKFNKCPTTIDVRKIIPEEFV